MRSDLAANFLNFLRGMETVRGEAVFIQKGAFLNFLRGMETLRVLKDFDSMAKLPKLP